MSAERERTGAAPLLEVERLTVRFRGLTAVDRVDLRVQSGEIFAVIGPNGAGKTTVFNAITGIYEPTEGVVKMRGADLRKPLRGLDYARWGVLGLLVGLFFLFFIADVDLLWSAALKGNYRGRAQTFSLSDAWVDFKDYMAAEPRVEQRAGRWQVVSFDGRIPLSTAKSEEEAEAKRQAVLAIGRLGSAVAIEETADGAVSRRPDGRTLDTYASRDQAEQRVSAARAHHGAAARARRTRWIAFFVGLFVGAGGGYAVWRQTRRTPATVALRGIARTFQNIRLFQEMTVLENVLVGMDRHVVPASRRMRARLVALAPMFGVAAALFLLALSLRWDLFPSGVNGALLLAALGGAAAWVGFVGRTGAFRRDDLATERDASAEAMRLLAFVGLDAKAHELSKNLAYGDQRRLEIARALATKPELLLLDEPAAGMNPAETVSLMKLIRKIRDAGTTVLLIEHHMRVVMGISDRIAVLVYGKKIAEGTPEEIRGNPEVIEAYLGKESMG